MVDESWGQKHFCHSCRARFYDLLRHPVVCPRCGARIDVPGDGSARRPPVASGLETAAVLVQVAPNGGGIVEAQVPVALATDDDVLTGVTIDDDSRELDDTDREDEDSTDDRIEGSDEYDIDEEKDADLDDEVTADDEEPEEGTDADPLADETDDDEELEDDELDEGLDEDELDDLDDGGAESREDVNSGGGDNAEKTELDVSKDASDVNDPKSETG